MVNSRNPSGRRSSKSRDTTSARRIVSSDKSRPNRTNHA